MDIIILDANLLMLLIIGAVDKSQIETHKRTRAFTISDFDQLSFILSKCNHIKICPNVVTEVSNLLDLKSSSDRRYAPMLLAIVGQFLEEHVKSDLAMSRAEYSWLGLTDAVLLSINSSGGVLLTVDDKLYAAAVSSNYKAIHFEHLRLGAHGKVLY